MTRAQAYLAMVALLGACGGGDYRPDGPEPEREPPIADGRGSGVRPPPPSAPPPAAPAPAAEAPAPSSNDAAEISRSVGKKGGAVVLWPRITMPKGSSGPDDAARKAARALQSHLAELTRSAFANRDIDVRPEPERVCKRPAGCAGVAVGVLLARAGTDGCSAVVTVSAPGAAPQRLVPWAGRVVVESATVAFRDAPERAVRFKDMARCSKIVEAARPNDKGIRDALDAAARGG